MQVKGKVMSQDNTWCYLQIGKSVQVKIDQEDFEHLPVQMACGKAVK